MKILNYVQNKIFNISKKRVTKPIVCDLVNDVFTNNVYKFECIKALNSQQPYELTFVLDKNGKCLGEFIGTAETCKIGNLPNKNKLVIIHGHPQRDNGKTLPVSLEDFEFLNRNDNVEKIIAFNKYGEHSCLRKGKGYTKLTTKQLTDLKSCYIQSLLKSADNSEFDKISSLIKYCRENSKNCDMVKQEIAERLDKLQFCENSNAVIDDFWKKVSSKYNLIYDSNFR